MSASANYSQSSENSKIQSNKIRAELLSRCEAIKDEVVALRSRVEDFKAVYVAARKAYDDERAAGVLTAQQLALKLSEVENLRRALDKKQAALDEKEKEVAALNRQIDALRAKKNFFKKVATYAFLVSAALAAQVVIRR